MESTELLELANTTEDAPQAEAQSATVSDDKPKISREEYIELATLRNQITALKADKLDVREFIDQAKANLAAAEARLEEIDGVLKETGEKLQGRFNEIIAPFNLEGQFRISDEEPHYIVPVDQDGPAV